MSTVIAAKRKLLWGGAIALGAMLVILGVSCTSAPEENIAVTTENCATCHNDTTLLKARQVQWENSLHATGGNFARSAKDCAICHTSEGFVERIAAGSMEIAADIKNPSPQNCRTCHDIHTTYTAADFALRTTAPVKLKLTGDTFNGGQGNLCASCHQPRWANPVPQVGGASVNITTTRYYPHYGVQSSMLLGVGGYGESTGASIHYAAVKDTCTTCHMAKPYGAQSGGHTMSPSYVSSTGSKVPNVSGCTSCHADIKSFDRNKVQTDVQAKLDELKALLLAKGIMDKSEYSVAGMRTSAQVGAYWNYKTVKYDGSLGVHNPAYTKKLLQTAIDALK